MPKEPDICNAEYDFIYGTTAIMAPVNFIYKYPRIIRFVFVFEIGLSGNSETLLEVKFC